MPTKDDPRITVRLTPEQFGWLRADAERLGLSVGAVVRLTLEAYQMRSADIGLDEIADWERRSKRPVSPAKPKPLESRSPDVPPDPKVWARASPPDLEVHAAPPQPFRCPRCPDDSGASMPTRCHRCNQRRVAV